jgi:hypothetical protein
MSVVDTMPQIALAKGDKILFAVALRWVSQMSLNFSITQMRLILRE